MKRAVLFSLLLFFILVLVGCNDYQRDGLVSPEKGRYSLYVMGDEQIDKKLDEEKESISNSVFRITSEPKDDQAKKDAPYLKIKKNKPNYFLFDTKDLVYQTTSYDKLIKYLEENPEPK